MDELTKSLDEEYSFCSGVRERYPIIYKWDEEMIQTVSVGFRDTPKSLYRFLYLWEPKEVDFSDMYKSVLALIRIHPKGIVSLDLYKYELAAYLYVTSDQVKVENDEDKGMWVCGAPGVENAQMIPDSEVYKEFKIFEELLTMKHHIYPGNDFEV